MFIAVARLNDNSIDVALICREDYIFLTQDWLDHEYAEGTQNLVTLSMCPVLSLRFQHISAETSWTLGEVQLARHFDQGELITEMNPSLSTETCFRAVKIISNDGPLYRCTGFSNSEPVLTILQLNYTQQNIRESQAMLIRIAQMPIFHLPFYLINAFPPSSPNSSLLAQSGGSTISGSSRRGNSTIGENLDIAYIEGSDDDSQDITIPVTRGESLDQTVFSIRGDGSDSTFPLTSTESLNNKEE